MHSFFNEQKEQSAAKARIVAKYFKAWSDVMLANMRRYRRITQLGYIDLFAGPGRYDDGSKSTPLLVLEAAIGNPELASILRTMFNDKDLYNVKSLECAVAALSGLSALRHQPKIFCGEVGPDAEAMFRNIKMCPTFSFIDPFGYKGLSQGFIQAMVKDWGCDCVFFFNYERINAGIANDVVRAHMDALFGQDRIERMRDAVTQMRPSERENFVLEELAAALKALGAPYILPFRFRRSDGSRTSHALIFVTKDRLGYEIMKDIMAAESSTSDQGVPSFAYSPADARCPLLFSLSQPLAALADDLAVKFAGCTLTMRSIYEQHSVDTRFVAKNYKKALGEMEADGRLSASPPSQDRPVRSGQRTFANGVLVRFPSVP